MVLHCPFLCFLRPVIMLILPLLRAARRRAADPSSDSSGPSSRCQSFLCSWPVPRRSPVARGISVARGLHKWKFYRPSLLHECGCPASVFLPACVCGACGPPKSVLLPLLPWRFGLLLQPAHPLCFRRDHLLLLPSTVVTVSFSLLVGC